MWELVDGLVSTVCAVNRFVRYTLLPSVREIREIPVYIPPMDD